MASPLPLVLVLLVSTVACSSSADRPNERGDGGGGTGIGGAAGSNAEGGSSAGKPSSGAAGEGPRGGSESQGGGGSSSEGGGSSAGKGAGGGSGGNDAPDEPGTEELGFTIRKPGPKNLDWLCTFNGASPAGHVYARLRQTGTKQAGIAEVPVYEVERAQLSLEGEVSELANAEYDYGGGHHNDSLSFDYDGKTHRYYHSSFGFGFRACQLMDCRNVYELGSTTLEEEGCASSRSLPEVCVTIEEDGTHAPLEDKFMKCPGSTP
jgi:hypothetical protein